MKKKDFIEIVRILFQSKCEYDLIDNKFELMQHHSSQSKSIDKRNGIKIYPSEDIKFFNLTNNSFFESDCTTDKGNGTIFASAEPRLSDEEDTYATKVTTKYMISVFIGEKSSECIYSQSADTLDEMLDMLDNITFDIEEHLPEHEAREYVYIPSNTMETENRDKNNQL